MVDPVGASDMDKGIGLYDAGSPMRGLIMFKTAFLVKLFVLLVWTASAAQEHLFGGGQKEEAGRRAGRHDDITDEIIGHCNASTGLRWRISALKSRLERDKSSFLI